MLPALLPAGYVYEMQSEDPGMDGPQNMRMLFQGGKLRMEMPSVRGEETSFIFDASSGTFTAIDHRRRQYTQFDEASMARFGDAMKEARRRMEEALQNVPASQRSMVEQMLGGQMPEAKELPEIRVEESGESREIAGINTKKYSIAADKEKVGDVWVAPFSSVPGSREVMQSFESLSGFVENLIQAMPAGLADHHSMSWMQAMGSLDGFPVASVMYEKGEEVASTLLKDFRSEDLAATEFEPPAGYKQAKLEMPNFGN